MRIKCNSTVTICLKLYWFWWLSESQKRFLALEEQDEEDVIDIEERIGIIKEEVDAHSSGSDGEYSVIFYFFSKSFIMEQKNCFYMFSRLLQPSYIHWILTYINDNFYFKTWESSHYDLLFFSKISFIVSYTVGDMRTDGGLNVTESMIVRPKRGRRPKKSTVYSSTYYYKLFLFYAVYIKVWLRE